METRLGRISVFMLLELINDMVNDLNRECGTNTPLYCRFTCIDVC